MRSTDRERLDDQEAWSASGEPRKPWAARRVFVVLAVTLLAWTVLYAPRMQEAARAHPFGTRRSASLGVLGPFAAVSRAIGLTLVTDPLERAVGLEPGGPPGGALVVPGPDPLPTVPLPPPPDPSDVSAVDTPTPIRAPTGRDKLRVVIVGDSLAAGVGYFAGRVFRPGLVEIRRQGRISSGLARPDYFDWYTSLRRIVAGYDPDLVIVMIGENDDQNILNASGRLQARIGTVDWPAAYRQRAAELMRIATQGGARVVWIGLPVQRERSRWTLIRRKNSIFEEASASVGDVAYLDAWGLFDKPNGEYSAFIRDGRHVTLVRAPDGLHFTPAGYTILVREAAELATAEFGVDPRAYSP